MEKFGSLVVPLLGNIPERLPLLKLCWQPCRLLVRWQQVCCVPVYHHAPVPAHFKPAFKFRLLEYLSLPDQSTGRKSTRSVGILTRPHWCLHVRKKKCFLLDADVRTGRNTECLEKRTVRDQAPKNSWLIHIITQRTNCGII